MRNPATQLPVPPLGVVLQSAGAGVVARDGAPILPAEVGRVGDLAITEDPPQQLDEDMRRRQRPVDDGGSGPSTMGLSTLRTSSDGGASVERKSRPSR